MGSDTKVLKESDRFLISLVQTKHWWKFSISKNLDDTHARLRCDTCGAPLSLMTSSSRLKSSSSLQPMLISRGQVTHCC